MNNFQGVERASLQYRLLPRLIVLAVICILIAVGASYVLTIFNLQVNLLYIIAIPVIIFVAFGLFILLSAYLEYSNLKYLIETNSLFLKEGVFSVDTETIPFEKIRNASFKQGFLQRLYGVGDVVIDQDPESYTWQGIDQKTAQVIMQAVAEKSNIQPIAVAQNMPNPYSVQPQ